ncbi:helix-turn-helix domain-containing protein [Pedobacter alpinus]|uniref:Helix-turn-helix domain-containing protein n=1 Tax=Pedobacter alpinus TaxID=1590643 RepID=A0ABW5TQ82_9SPHI
MNLGQKIREIRNKQNIKQEELSVFLRITQGQLSKMENGKTFISFEQVINIATYTNTQLHYFLPNDLEKIQQLDFKIQLETMHQEIMDQKETIKHLLKNIRLLELELRDLKNYDEFN